jgi:chemotaxis regulatin CheY-phosphate phosphatase CheZ
MPLSEADYDMIESAVLETTRGRWFLAEYARRNRHADTTMLLGAIERLEASLRGEATPRLVDRLRFDLVEMANSIVRTKAEIATIKPDADQHGKFGEATEELDSIVQATETATSEILAAAEQVQEIAWTLREQGLDPMVCDTLDARATEIYTACSFQDLTGQRTSKVIEVMRYLEGRINAMIDIWGLRGTMSAEAEVAAEASQADVLSGPARPGYGLDQSAVDVVMGPPMGALGARTASAERSGGDRAEREARRSSSGDPGTAPEDPPCEAPSVQHQLDPAAADRGTNSRADGLTAGLSHETSQALARIEALTVEEKLALFS